MKKMQTLLQSISLHIKLSANILDTLYNKIKLIYENAYQ